MVVEAACVRTGGAVSVLLIQVLHPDTEMLGHLAQQAGANPEGEIVIGTQRIIVIHHPDTQRQIGPDFRLRKVITSHQAVIVQLPLAAGGNCWKVARVITQKIRLEAVVFEIQAEVVTEKTAETDGPPHFVVINVTVVVRLKGADLTGHVPGLFDNLGRKRTRAKYQCGNDEG